MKSDATDFACLAFIAEGAASGYEIFRASRSGTLRFVFTASQATIYEALRRLEQRGALVAQRVAQRGRPDKVVYRCTEAGRRLIPQLGKSLLKDGMDRTRILLLVRFAASLPRSILDSALEERSARLQRETADLAEIEAGLAADSAGLLSAFRDVLRAEQSQLVAIGDYVRAMPPAAE